MNIPPPSYSEACGSRPQFSISPPLSPPKFDITTLKLDKDVIKRNVEFSRENVEKNLLLKSFNFKDDHGDLQKYRLCL
jgi:hypothetical protein